MSSIEVIDCSRPIIAMLTALAAYLLVREANDLTFYELLSYLISFRTKTAGSIDPCLKLHYDNFACASQTDFNCSIGHFVVGIVRIP